MVARLSSLCLSFIVFLATSRGQQCDGIVSDGVNCQVTFPDYDVEFPIPSDDRGICIPSVTESGARIKTLVLKFSYQPDCVEVGLSACFSDNSTVYVDTNDLFASETDPGDFDIIVNGKNTTVEYGPNGTHSILPDTRTVSPLEPFQIVQWRSYFSGAPTAKRLCAVGNDDRLMDYPDFIDYELVKEPDELSCVTDEDLTRRLLVLEHKIMKKEGMIAYPETYRLVIANGGTSCNSASRESPVLTLTVEGPLPTPSPSPTPLPPSNEPPRGGGTNVVAIAVGATAAVVLIIVLAVLLFVLLYKYWWKRRSPKIEDGNGPAVHEELGLEVVEPETKQPLPPAHPPKGSVVAVLDTATGDSTLGQDLAKLANADFEAFQSHEEEQGGMLYFQRTNIILNSERYIWFFIIYRESPEKLMRANPLAWDVVKNIRTRAYSKNTLEKVVFVQVTSKTLPEEGKGGKILDEYTVGITENILHSSRCASIIISKVNMMRNINIASPPTSELPEETDEGVLVHHSPEGSPLPRDENRPAPPPYPSQSPNISLSEAGRVNDSQVLITEVRKLTHAQVQVLGELKKQTKLQEKTAENTGQTAVNTGDMREDLEETRLTISETNDMLQRRSVSEDQPDLS